MLTFHEVQPLEDELQIELLELFTRIFPEYRRYDAQILRSMQSGRELNPRLLPHHWLIFNDDRAIGFTLFNYLIEKNFGFGRYIGVDPAQRSSGIGLRIIRETKQQICEDAKIYNHPQPIGYCAEVESAAMARNEKEKEINIRRLDYFINRCGAIELDVDYLEPTMIQGQNAAGDSLPPEPTPMHLLLYPINPNRNVVDPDETRMMIEGVLFDHYRLDPENNSVKTILNSIPGLEVKL